MRVPWLDERAEGWGRRLALLPLDLVAPLYGVGARLHRALYRRDLLTRVRLGCRVVSIGNLVLGGSGKTPMTAFLARELRRRGHRVAIASRGYGGRNRERVVVVSDGRHVLSRAEEAGDEPMLLAGHAPGVPVLVGAQRWVVGQRAIASFGTEVLLLDDGFTHHSLHRDVDLIVFDGHFGLGNGRLLPRGPLREPRSVLRLADAIGVVDGPLPDEDEAIVARASPLVHRFAARRVPVALRPLAGGPAQSVTDLEGRKVGLLAGIARPDSLRRSLIGLGAQVVAERSFGDHHRYRPRDLSGLAAETPLWITTEKDALKIHPSWTDAAEVQVLVIDVELEEPAPFLDWLSGRLR